MVVMAPVKKTKHNSSFQKKEEKQMEVEEMNEDENGAEGEDGDDKVPDDIQIIAQEVQIVKSLACNDLTQRNRQMKKLRKWLQLRTKSSFPFTQEDFMRIWKGLYYNMWYSDKPLVQEELAEQLGRLLECFEGNLQYSVDFFGAFLKTMCIEWFGIDQWRIDKFLMLARRMLRYMFKLLKNSEWSLEALEVFNKHATETVLFENVSAKGLTMHYFDIFFEELAKVSEGKISAEQVGVFVKPFVKFMATQRDFNLISHCRTRVFYHLLYQSGLGREYSEKYNAWKEMGFPTKHIDDLEKVEESEHEDNVEAEPVESNAGNKHLDPRAGNVDVFMPELPLDAEPVIKETEHFLYKEECATKRRKILKKLLDLFKTYQSGEFPLGIKTMPRFEGKSEKPLIKEKIKQLDNLENELYGVDRKLKQMTKRKRRKFLKSLNFDDIDESNYEQSLEKALPKDYLKERRKRSQKSFMSAWIEEELDEEDLKPKKAKKESLNNDENVTGQGQKIHNKKNKLKPQNSEIEDSIESVKKSKKVENSLKLTSIDDTPVAINKKSNKNKAELAEQNNNNDIVNKVNKQSMVLKISDPQEQSTPKSKPKESKVLKISDADEQITPKSKKKPTNEWDEPLGEGEVEYFLPSRKLQVKKANADLVLNPLAKQRLADNQSTPVNNKKASFSATNTPKTPGSNKRVKIALKHNTSQNPLEYIQQIKSSPNIPYDAKKKPGKGLLKPNAMPSPINPFYKKKIGLKLLNDTI
ncbi:putative ribosomal RNA processing protein 1 [Lucilia cuprina]|uniref:Putative ribosomal RNA processing protein 1 n=1 Tax=Lucilia cuprina TaxID=7375 RepID=A0A0L0C1Q2_LUCCU|nr:putative ribosomal RNA processing protein 1 [Lucilia cuprina]